ncbi:hypothetical protein HY417_04325 [Candidatus Kaiserbacteria bacterium]|nr:hypothetical protein [Candidatus Kaiserbacteria bacterium]
MSDGPESVVPKEFLRQAKPLAESEKQGGSAIVSSVDEAKRELGAGNLKYPILVIPVGEGSVEKYHVVNSEEELADAVEEALPVSVGKRVHLVSRYPEKLESRSVAVRGMR